MLFSISNDHYLHNLKHSKGHFMQAGNSVLQKSWETSEKDLRKLEKSSWQNIFYLYLFFYFFILSFWVINTGQKRIDQT